ncbi:patatin-like phospholipase family protein [Nannocystis radixulma]|uniref:Patatin-like phospholipase family protein n=1 Tax=Nannocystis radixulma TaxID=2995305 RepID=A0ABT5BFI0_9BACT|nr:patatin-like phospholipase family protein [Nannocystis radixulma]MDC0672370.1 patatin-like phospholipase family protein [Nannocystis radixulma]
MSHPNRKRSLLLAAGGLKTAFQAGVLQVWLDEAGVRFDHADGCGAGMLNLAMVCQGMSGAHIADRWCEASPGLAVDFDWTAFPRLLHSPALVAADVLRERVFHQFGLDFAAIRRSKRTATFNLYNFTRQRLTVVPQDEITEDHLMAGLALPMWFPPVEIGEERYIESVFVTGANVEEAIRRGADELWIIWTISERGEWQDGFVANYFQIMEAAANGHLQQNLARIEANNAAITAGRVGEFGRTIDVKLLRAEVPIHYLLNLSHDRLVEAVQQGVEAGRAFCRHHGVPLGPPHARSMPTRPAASVQFEEEMRGHLALGETDPARGATSSARNAFSVRLRIETGDIERFVTDPAHRASATGTATCAALGGELPITDGTFQLLVDEPDPRHKRMRYQLHFRDRAGRPLTLMGHKVVEDDPGLDVWRDNTTLYTQLLDGHGDPGAAKVCGAGILYIHPLDFLRQLSTMRGEGPGTSERIRALSRFGRLFWGKLWDVYARQVLAYGPL